MARKRHKAVGLIKEVRLEAGRRQFVTIPRSGNRYVWDPRPGTYFLEWWEGKQRKREAPRTVYRSRFLAEFLNYPDAAASWASSL